MTLDSEKFKKQTKELLQQKAGAVQQKEMKEYKPSFKKNNAS